MYICVYIYIYIHTYTYIIIISGGPQASRIAVSLQKRALILHEVSGTHGSFPIGLISNWARF